MHPVIARITFRQLLSRRRTILLALLGLVMVLLVLALRVSGDVQRPLVTTAAIYNHLGVAALMPLVALIFGTGAIGSELDEGTAVYLVAKPISRTTILVTKLAVAAACSIVVTCIPMLVAGLIGAGGLGGGLVLGFTVAAAIGSVIYCAIFVTLSLVTSRALVVGLAYVLIWEGVLASLFPGTRTFSVRQVTLALAEALGDPSPGVFRAELDLTPALIVGTIALAGAVVVGIRRLVQLEIAGEAV